MKLLSVLKSRFDKQPELVLITPSLTVRSKAPQQYRIFEAEDVFAKYIDPKFKKFKPRDAAFAASTISVFQSKLHWSTREQVAALGGFERYVPEWQVIEFCRLHSHLFLTPGLTGMGCDSILFLIGQTENGDVIGARVVSALEGLEVWLERADFHQVNAGWKICIPDQM